MLEEFGFGFPILSYLIFLPLVGAAVLWLIEDEDLVRTAALGISLIELALAVLVLLGDQLSSGCRWYQRTLRRSDGVSYRPDHHLFLGHGSQPSPSLFYGVTRA